MTFLIRTLILLTLGAQALLAQTGEVLLKFSNGTTVQREEFEYVFSKNNGGMDAARKATPKQVEDYLKLFVQFKRKVLEAERLGLDTTRSFQAELGRYLSQLAQPYLIERDVLEQLVKEAYDRSGYALRVSHILVRLPENPSPDDTLNAWKKVNALRDSVVRLKQNFADIARRNSDDPGAADNGGYLSWFTAFDFIYPFESAAFQTPVGQISPVVRTQFGYHIIQVHEKKAIPGKPVLAHILVRSGPSYVAQTAEEAKARAQEVYTKLKSGGDFTSLAAEYSDDPNSKTRGGDLGSRYIGLPDLQDLRFKLAQGQVSEPIETNVGWHIVKVTQVEANKSFEDQKASLKARVSKDPRAQVAEEKLLQQLKKEYKYAENSTNQSLAMQHLQQNQNRLSVLADSVDPKNANLVMATFADQKVTYLDVLKNARQARKANSTRLVPAIFQDALASAVRTRLLQYEETQLEHKYPDYRNLRREYRDGILLFTLTEDKVWRKAVDDTAGLRKYYDTHRDSFPATERARLQVYRSRSVPALEKIQAEYNLNHSLALVDTLIRKEKLAVRSTTQYAYKNDSDELAKSAYQRRAGEFLPIREANGNQELYLVQEFLPAGIKSFDEARAEAITKYQNYLEQAWLRELEQRYPYELNKATYKKLFK